jgi:chaperonin cofactor prefoldin
MDKATVSGELAGFRLVVESLNQRMASLESRQESLEAEMREIQQAINARD